MGRYAGVIRKWYDLQKHDLTTGQPSSFLIGTNFLTKKTLYDLQKKNNER
jgi:hypothetical protein